MNRRTFLLTSAGAAAGAAYVWHRGRPSDLPITGTLSGPSVDLGHLLRDGGIPEPTTERRIPVAILGGGISGLSAGWKLQKAGFTDFEVLEMESDVGGNSRFGENRVTPYPWGAHYLPLPTEESRAVRELLEELGVIEGYTQDGQPVYQERALCFAPQERLFIHGRWQEGLMPVVGITARDQEQYGQFREMITHYTDLRGADGRKAFAIPMAFSSQDPALLALDQGSMRDFLIQQGLDSKALHWYVNYACRDDYGCTSADVSAWIGLHYFASRDSSGFENIQVLTWPEGNGWIVRQLRQKLTDRLVTGAMVTRLEHRSDLVQIDVHYPQENRTETIKADRVIYACPQFLTPYLIADLPDERKAQVRQFEYAPWLVANITLKAFPAPDRRRMPLAWDNVIYDSPSLGYVVATHQSVRTHQKETVFTYYYPLSDGAPADERKRLLDTSWETWVQMILSDLSRPHPEIGELIRQVDIFRWGHGMVRPRPGFVWSEARRNVAAAHGQIHFAHSDLSGFSIFEEAQYRGVAAAEQVLDALKVPFTSSV